MDLTIFLSRRSIVIESIIVCVLTFIAFKFLQLYRHVQKQLKIFGNMPGPPRHWLYGNMHLLPHSWHERLTVGLEISDTYQPLYAFWGTFFLPVVVVSHASTVKEILKTTGSNVLVSAVVNEKTKSYEHLKLWELVKMPEGGDERLKFAFDNCSKYQPLHVFWAMFWWPVLVCTHASTAKAMLKTTEKSMGKKSHHEIHAISKDFCCHLPDGPSENRLKYGLENVNKNQFMYIWWNTGMKPSVTVCHPSTVRTAMKTSEPKPTGFFGVYRLALPWLGEGLLIAGGDRWTRSRRLLTPAFHFEILKPYIDVYNDAANILIENLGKFADSGEKFEVFTYISKVTLDIILRCAFSYHTDVQREGVATHPYVKAVEEISDGWQHRARRIWLYPDWLFYLTPKGRTFRKQCNYVHQVAEEIIEKRRKTLKENGTSDRKYLDFLDILLTAKDENGVGLTPIEIRNEVDTFLFEGHDTTASAISWILYALATHPEYQKKCQEEIDNILQGRDDVEWDDVSKMDYLTMCIKEGMRDHCPVPFIQREFTHSFEINGHKFPAGTTVSLHIYGLHHNKHVWENPMEYIPERFSKENVANMDPYQFVPFSAGPRNCIGQHFAMNEEKVVLAKLLKKFEFAIDPTHDVKKKVAAVMRAENGIMMYVKRR